MNKGDDKLVVMFQSKCLRRLILRVHWKEQMRTEDLLERAQMKSLSEEVKAMIGHTLRQDQENDGNVAMKWAPEGKTWKKGTTENKMAKGGGELKNEKRGAGAHGMRCGLQ